MEEDCVWLVFYRTGVFRRGSGVTEQSGGVWQVGRDESKEAHMLGWQMQKARVIELKARAY